MKRLLIVLPGLCLCVALSAQNSRDTLNDAWKKIYRATPVKINDLVHTRLDVRFDYEKTYLYGKAWITLTPHFYPTDSLDLDAKGMDIHTLSILKNRATVPLHYTYNGLVLHIHLDKTYTRGEKYTLYVDYTAKPNEFQEHGSAAITDAKGLYFINPHGTEKGKPTQIWTQGETESNSVWFPTIDKPDQKSTEEITMTVPSKYVTLSNGRLIAQKKNADGTRTDTWKLDLPNAPYLFFMGVGDYAVIHDHYKNKPVDYYVEKEYAPVARRIFGHTPEMMAFFSRVLGMDFPWNKYAQMTARDYVSGAMENTTATLHTDALQQDARQLADGNAYEVYVAHELFHQWFGDLVTTESWSNLTVNESFANFSEMLWMGHEYGRDAGDAVNFDDTRKYLSDENGYSKDLVRFYYADREDMFDDVTYSKGGRILNMLRNYVGDSAFFKALNLYLNTHKFKTAEAQDLRLAFEEVTGQDLNWYWNQWYYGSGHPKLDISYAYDDAAKKVTVTISQTQEGNKVFKLPMAIDVYEGDSKKRYKVWVNDKTDSFTFSYHSRPELVNVDADKITLCEKEDHKTLDNFIYQYQHAGLYMDRREAIDFCIDKQDDPKALDLLKTAMKDRYYGLREYTLNSLDMEKAAVKSAVEPILLDIAEHDDARTVKAKAIELLGTYNKADYKTLFLQNVNDSSYSVSGSALSALNAIDQEDAYSFAQKFVQQPAKGDLVAALIEVFATAGDQTHYDELVDDFDQLSTQKKLDNLPYFAGMVLNNKNTDEFKKGVDAIVKLRDGITGEQKEELSNLINERILQAMQTRKEADGLKEQADYIRSKLKKGF